jgi:hypothetical protein
MRRMTWRYRDLLDIERQETELVFRGQSERLPIEHRADISPLALLGLQLVTRGAAAALPETSPGLAIDVLMPGGR